MKNITEEDKRAIENDEAEFIGKGPWEKNAAYRVYKIQDRYVSVIVVDNMSKWLEMDMASYITEEEVNSYV